MQNYFGHFDRGWGVQLLQINIQLNTGSKCLQKACDCFSPEAKRTDRIVHIVLTTERESKPQLI